MENINLFFFVIVKNITSFFGRIQLTKDSLSEITGLLPVIGYGMVIMSFIDFAYVIFPLQLQNPEWEINTITALTNNFWAFLIGLGFIFSRYFSDHEYDTRLLEVVFLRVMRWIILLMGIVILLFAPLVMLNTDRILKVVNNRIVEEQNNSLEQIAKVEQVLASNVSSEEIQLLARNINVSPEDLKLPTPQLKEKIQQNLMVAKQKIPQEAKQAQRQQKINRWKNSSRTVIGLMIIGLTCIIVWLKIGQAHI
ncbi:hypothetical protein H6F32_15705 [Anabaena sp. FACHB-1237]|uniref:HpsJ-like protein, cyanoexosortase A-associated n=1 Tax=Anabaena sp. FACHB-1237 TaxID=2692769 RepID=UPI0016801567|nr:HpsJ family protein [Anabaena sp. FACHB-1237]MBD2138982.1 hypothetical protein [Anabaena sp. FACHB-1237]